MKIGNKELKESYNAFLNCIILDENIKCPKKSEIWTFFNRKKSEKRKTKIVNHITICKSCRSYFELIMNVRKSHIAFNLEIEEFINSIQSVSWQKRIQSHQIASPQTITKVGLSIFGIVFLAISFFLLVKDNTMNLDRVDSRHVKANMQIILVRPLGENIIKRELAFHWSKNKLIKKYYIELYDESLSLVWKSSLMTINTLIVPSAIIEKLCAQQSYYWMVYGIEKSGRVYESTLGRFVLE